MLRDEVEHLRRQLVDARDDRERFLNALSHELRTPLVPVLLAITAIESDASVPERVYDDLAMIRRNIELELRLIDEMLDLNRASAGKLPLSRENVGLHRLLKLAAEGAAAEAHQKQIRWQFDLAATRDVICVDAARMQQVFWNLLKNAVKFSGVGQEIELYTHNPTSDAIEFVCRDHGIGVSSDALPRLFSAFEQGDPTVTRKFGGMGLGLAISRAVVEAHGGTLTAESRGTGHGSSFTVRLPLAEAGVTAAPVAPKPVPTVGPQQPLKLLLVEDHEDTARVLRRLLRLRGYDVRLAASATAALAAAEVESFDMIVSDIGLPDQNGYELMRRLRERGFAEGIAMTGYGRDDDIAQSREAGFAAHVVKPVDLQQLDRTIQMVMNLRKSGKNLADSSV